MSVSTRLWCWLAPLWTIVCLAVVVPAALSQTYTFQQFTQENGLENSAVRALLQDGTGFLWVGTANGLYRYDGARFRAYREQDGLPSGRILGLAETSDGTLWAGTREGLAWKSDLRFVPVAYPDRIIQTVDTGMATDENGGVYVGSTIGLFRVRRGRGADTTVVRLWPAVGLPAQPVAGVFRERSGTVWFGCASSMCRLDGGVIKTGEGPGLPEDVWTGIAVDNTGTLWVRNHERLFYRPRGAARFMEEQIDAPASTRSAGLFLDPSGNLAVPSELGLFRRRAGRWDRLDMRHGLAADPVSVAFWDREGSPWIGLEAHGLARWLGYGEWESWTNRQGLTTNTVTAVARDAAGELYVGTRYGLNRYHPSSGTWKQWFSRDGLPNDEVRAVVPDPRQGIWVASAREGLAWFDPRANRFFPVGAAAGLASPAIVSLSLDHDGVLWAGTREGLFRAVPDGAATRFSAVPTELSGRGTAYRVLRDSQGTLWIAGTEGLRGCREGVCRSYTEDDGLRHKSLTSLATDRDGGLWVSYAHTIGVSRLVFSSHSSRPVVTHFNRSTRHLRSDDISFVCADGRGRIWIGSDAGVDEYDGGAWSHYRGSDGLVWPDTVLNAFWPDRDGSVWIGTSGGISHFLRRRPAPVEAPRIVITSIHAAGQPVAVDQGQGHSPMGLRSGAMEFEFAAVTFRDPDNIRYRYRIEGATPGWIETESHRVVIPDLPPGPYVFEVSASRYADWSAPARFSFDVLAPWWASKLFRLALALAFGLVAVALWQIRVRHLMETKDQLEVAVRERTQQLEQERDRTQQEKAIVEFQKGEIEELLGKAREVNRLKDEFLANMSHEIRTPMNGVLGMTALALSTDLTNEQRDYLRTVQFSARNLLQLLNEILDFSKIEAGRMELERLPFSLNECVRESLKTLASLAREKHLQLNLRIAPGTPDAVVGDPQRMRQIILNLVSNAIKFTERGAVTIAVEKEREAGTLVWIHLTVTDTGIGIAPEKLAVVFEPFRQADGSTTRRYGGTGLGLAICARLVKLMNGTIDVESDPTTGSRFHVRIPLTRNFNAVAPLEPDPHRELEPHQNGNGWPLQVLLVEDDPVSRRLATRILEKRGYMVIAAENGREAIEMLEQVPVELILMDVMMPEVDGLTATRIIREREGAGRVPRLPIYILTANAMTGDRERCLAAGADGYLTKPIEPSELNRALDELRGRLAR